MSSFASELGIQFETCLEAPHVIDVESQLWAGVISRGPGNCQLNASYKTSDGYAFQDSVGKSLEEIFKIVPGGVLVFFPSYKLLDKLQNRWCQTGQWSRLDDQKSLFVEPRSKTDDFDNILKRYYESIHGNKIIKRGQRRVEKRSSKESSSFRGGAAFLAVCRGKVSEGIDFSDDNARAVVIVGIPFPNINDIQVTLKKKYNDSCKSSKSLLTGSQWYCHQAFRALNQAAGRCIRHRFDYGAIIFLDERFKEERNIAYISRWIRKSIKRHDTIERTFEELKSFFASKVLHDQHEKAESSKIKEKSLPKTILYASKLNKENIWHSQGNILKKCNTGKVVQKPFEAHEQSGRKPHSTNLKKDLYAQVSIPDNDFLLSSSFDAEAYDMSRKLHLRNEQCSNIELYTKPRLTKLSLCSSHTITDNLECSEETVVRDSLVQNSMCKGVDSHSNTAEIHNEIPKNAALNKLCLSNSYRTIEADACSASITTPEKGRSLDVLTSEPETCLSVNYHHQKRRKINLKSCVGQLSCIDSHPSESCCLDPTYGSSTNEDLNQRKEVTFGGSTECEGEKMSSNTGLCKNLHICCNICRNPLGMQEKKFIISCSLDFSSKVYLSRFLKVGHINNCSSKSLCYTNSTNIPVVITDTSSINQSLFNSHTTDGVPQEGIWSEPDGCVFKIIYCPFCEDTVTYLGLHVIATDSLNANLIDKVFFYVERLYMENDSKEREVSLSEPAMEDNIATPRILSSESCLSTPKSTISENTFSRKSKLKLPRREDIL